MSKRIARLEGLVGHLAAQVESLRGKVASLDAARQIAHHVTIADHSSFFDPAVEQAISAVRKAGPDKVHHAIPTIDRLLVILHKQLDEAAARYDTASVALLSEQLCNAYRVRDLRDKNQSPEVA